MTLSGIEPATFRASRPGPQPPAPPPYIETVHSFLKSDGDILKAAILQTLDVS
jgi:hypothetical protein